MKQRIVILGGGFGGLTTAIHLAKKKVDAEIILIDERDYHLYTPWLYRIPSDIWHERKRRMCEFYFKNLFKQYGDRIHFRQNSISGINIETQHIKLGNGNTVRYDLLVLGLGSRVNYYGMQDIEKGAYILNTPSAVEKMYKDLEPIMKEVKKGKKRHVVIAGAGPTGVETATELASLRKKHHIPNLDITLIDAGSSLLPHFSECIQRASRRRASKLKLRVLHGARVTGLNTGGTISIDKNGLEEKVHADLLLWSGGVQPNPLIADLSLEKDERGRIKVNAHLQVKNKDNIFALGDVASVWDEVNQCAVPPTAWAAVDQGAVLASTLEQITKGQEVTATYRPPKKYPGVISLGYWYAAGGGYGIQLKGIIGWIGKQFIHIQYFAVIMSWRSALRAWLTKTHICGTKN